MTAEPPPRTAVMATHQPGGPVSSLSGEALDRIFRPARKGFSHPALGIATLIVAAALPFLASGYQTFQMTMLMIYAIALLGLNILTGYSGQLSLGHGAFFAAGAYTMAIVVAKLELPYWLGLPAAGLFCLALGYVFGRPAARLSGHYLAMATFSLAIALPPILKFKGLQDFTGGANGIGISASKIAAPFNLPLNVDQWLYLVTLATALVMFVLAHGLLTSNTGRAFRAIRDNQIAAEAMGINLAHTKSLCFGISAAYAGVAGALSTLAVRFIAPDSFTFILSITLLVGIVVGGLGTIAGAVIGAAFILYVPSFAESLSKAAPWAIYGILLIGMMFVLPGGVTSIGREWRSWRDRLRSRSPP